MDTTTFIFVLIGIPYAAVIGGFMTPVGTAVNLVALSLYEQATGHTIRFLDWRLVGIPAALISIVICCWVLVKMYCGKGLAQVKLRQADANDIVLDTRDRRILIMWQPCLSCGWPAHGFLRSTIPSSQSLAPASFSCRASGR